MSTKWDVHEVRKIRPELDGIYLVHKGHSELLKICESSKSKLGQLSNFNASDFNL